MVRLETPLRYSGIFLKALSFSTPSLNASRIETVVNLAHFLIVVLFAALMVLQIFVYIIQNSTDFRFVTEHITAQVGFILLRSKIILYRMNKEKLIRLSNDMNNMLKNGSQQLKNRLQEYASTGNTIYFAYIMTALLLVTEYCLMPLFKAERTLPIVAWYPFDYKTSMFLYCVAYSHQICVMIMCWLGCGIDVIYGVMVFGCCARCKITQEMLGELNKPDISQLQQSLGVKFHTEFDKKITKIVDLHCEVFNSAKDINDMHTYILLVLFLTSLMIICCTGYQITNVSEQTVNSRFIFSVMVCSVLCRLLFYVVPGDRLANELIILTGYQCRQEIESALFMMTRSAIPPKLQVGRVTPVLLKNYASFLATTVSYFTSLQAVVGVN